METPTLAQALEDKAALHRPHQNYCLCRQIRMKRGSLFMPSYNKDNHLYLKVLRTGPGFRRADGTRIEMDVAVGDVVLVKNVGPLLLPGETELYHIRETDVVTTFTGEVVEVDYLDTVVMEPEPAPSEVSPLYNPDGVMIVMAKPKTGSRKM